MRKVPALLNLSDIQERLNRAEFIQPVAEHIIFPQQNLTAFGFQEPLNVPEQLHLAIHFLDKNGERTVEIHGLGHKPGEPYQPAVTGFKPTHLQCHGQDPHFADGERANGGYRTTPGAISEIGSSRLRAERFDNLLTYMRASRRVLVPYSAPLDTTRKMIRAFWQDFAPETPAGKAQEKRMKRKRDICCRLLLAMPTPLLGAALTVATGRRMRMDGYNSNPVAGDVATIMGRDIRPHYRHEQAPFIQNSIKPWMNLLPAQPAGAIIAPAFTYDFEDTYEAQAA